MTPEASYLSKTKAKKKSASRWHSRIFHIGGIILKIPPIDLSFDHA
jgi:hypothetical protein